MRLKFEQGPNGRLLELLSGDQVIGREEINLDELVSGLQLPYAIEKGLRSFELDKDRPVRFLADSSDDDDLVLEKLRATPFGPVALFPGFRFSRHIENSPISSHDEALRVLLVSANPGSAKHKLIPKLDSEMLAIEQILSNPNNQHVVNEPLRNATPGSFRTAIEEFRPNVIHFMGHGEKAQTGDALVLHGLKKGEESYLYVDEFAQWLVGLDVKLVSFFACDLASHRSAVSLIKSGVRAYLAMRDKWNNGASTHFACEFFSTLIQEGSVDEAMYKGREFLRDLGDQWSIPILYTDSGPDVLLKRSRTLYGIRGGPANAVEENFEELGPGQKELLRSLNIFSGFGLEDAEAVIGEGSSFSENLNIFRELSLLEVSSEGPVVRYSIPKPVVDLLARETSTGLERNRLDELKENHAAHYCEVARGVDTAFREGRWTAATKLLSQELCNFHCAVEHCAKVRNDPFLYSFFDSLGKHLIETNRGADFDLLADATLRAATFSKSIYVQERVLKLKAIHETSLSHFEEAEEIWNERTAIAEAHHDSFACAESYLQLASRGDDCADVEPYLVKALTAAKAAQSPELEASCEVRKAQLAWGNADESAMRQAIQRAEALLESCKDVDLMTSICASLARMYASLEEPEKSESLLEQMICIAYQREKVFCVGSLLLEFANLMSRSQNAATAAHAFISAAKIHAQLGSQLREKSEAAFFLFKQSHSHLDSLIFELTNQDWRSLVRTLISK